MENEERNLCPGTLAGFCFPSTEVPTPPTPPPPRALLLGCNPQLISEAQGSMHPAIPETPVSLTMVGPMEAMAKARPLPGRDES